MRDDVTLQRRLSLAGSMLKMNPGHWYGNIVANCNVTYFTFHRLEYFAVPGNIKYHSGSENIDFRKYQTSFQSQLVATPEYKHSRQGYPGAGVMIRFGNSSQI